MARIAIVVGHGEKSTFCEALGEAYRRGAAAGGHEAAVFILPQMTFDPILHEGFERPQPLEPDLQAARNALLAANHIVIIFPLWLGDMPALLKGFLERVFQPDLIPFAKAGKFARFLKGKSVRLIVTMGMPALIYRWYFGPHVLRILRGNILGLLGAGPVRSTLRGSIESVSEARRKEWLAHAESLGRHAA